MEKTNIKELNIFLKGEYMAISAYENYIQRVGDPDVRYQLQKIQQKHKDHAKLLSERIQNLGERPTANEGLMGNVFNRVSQITERNDTDPFFVLKDAYDGEKKGINEVSEISFDNVDAESNNMINNILDEDRQDLTTLKTLMNDFTN